MILFLRIKVLGLTIEERFYSLEGMYLASLLTELAAVGAVCAVFMVLFVVAGIKQMLDRRE